MSTVSIALLPWLSLTVTVVFGGPLFVVTALTVNVPEVVLCASVAIAVLAMVPVKLPV